MTQATSDSNGHAAIDQQGVGDYTKGALQIYGNYVVTERALADMRDGLKPVQRRILWSMWNLGATHNKAHKKCALITGHTMGCFTGDTRVHLLDGSSPTFEELKRTYKPQDEFWVYSLNIKTQEVVAGKARHPRVTKYVTALVEIEIDSGETIRCTPEHKILCRNGKYVEAQTLKPGASLMPLYATYGKGGYEFVIHPAGGQREETHRAVLRSLGFAIGRKVGHHKKTTTDNSPDNLECLTSSEHHGVAHGPEHSATMKARWQDPSFRAPVSDAVKQAHKDPARKSIQRAAGLQTCHNLATYARSTRSRVAKSALMGGLNKRQGHQLKAHTNKCLKVVHALIQQGLSLNESNYHQVRAAVNPKAPSWWWLKANYQDMRTVRAMARTYNHKVVSVKQLQLPKPIPVYDLTVDKYHNFAVSCGDTDYIYKRNGVRSTAKQSIYKTGVFVHNSYHPHGDAAIYGALVGMVHDNYALVEGHGNFGSYMYGAAAQRYCVTGDTLVDTAYGLIRIEDLHSYRGKVATLEGKNANVSKWFDSGKHLTKQVRTRSGFRVTGTKNHPLLVLTPDLALVWKPIGEIKVGDCLCVNRGSQLFPQKLSLAHYKYSGEYTPGQKLARGGWGPELKTLPQKMTPQFARVLGYLIAEGSINQRKIEFCNSDLDVLLDFKQSWEACFPDTRLHRFDKPARGDAKPYSTFEIHSRHAIDFLQFCGLAPVKSAGKTVPWSILCADRSSVAAFISAYFEGDGGTRASVVSACSVAEQLLQEIQLLLLKFGIVARLGLESSATKHLWHLAISDRDQLVLFDDEIGFRSARKKNVKRVKRSKTTPNLDKVPYVYSYVAGLLQSRFVRSASRYGHIYLNDLSQEVRSSMGHCSSKTHLTLRSVIQKHLPNISVVSKVLANKLEYLCSLPYYFDPVVSIASQGRQQVYDLTIGKTHAFTGNGILCHNTESRLSELGERYLDDIAVAEMIPNYSSTAEEPLVLPVKAPMLLVNGSAGIGVGISAAIPAHNLGEVIQATLALLYKPGTTIKSLLKHIQGPDYGDGVLVSGQEELLELYTHGKGTLYYRCRYHYEEAADHKILVVDSTCPGFNLYTFFDVCSKLIEKGLLSYCSDQSSGDGIRILVGFTNPSIIEQRVLPALTKSESYQFWAVKRHQNLEKLTEDTLKYLDLKGLLQEFIDFRLAVEKARLEALLASLAIALSKAEALLAASTNIDEVYAVLTKTYADKDAAQQDLATRLAITFEQAGYVLAAQVWSLTKLNQQDQAGKVKAIKQEVKQAKSKLGDLPAVVAETLKSMLVYSADRGMEVGTVPEAIPGSDDASVIVMARSNGYLTRDVTMDIKARFYYDYVLTCSNWVGVADGTSCKIYQRYVSYFSEDSTKLAIVGLINSQDDYVVAIDERGLGCFIANTPFDGYYPIKDASELKSVCGLRSTDLVIFLDDQGQGVIYKVADFVAYLQRRNSKGYKIDELEGQTIRVLRAANDTKMYDDMGEVKTDKLGLFSYTGTLHLIGTENYVLTTIGKRLVLDRKEATLCYDNGELQQVQLV